MEDKIKTCCDSVQEKIQRRLDRNLDIFDRFVKKNISVARGALDSADTPSSAMDSGTGGSGSGSAGVTVAKRGRATDGVEDWSGFEIDKTATPKRLEDEKEVDADLERIRERRRKVGRRMLWWGYCGRPRQTRVHVLARVGVGQHLVERNVG